MFEIVFTVCSILQGARCEPRAMTYEDTGQTLMPYACMLGAMTELAKWTDQHPNWSIASWRCQPAGQFAKI